MKWVIYAIVLLGVAGVFTGGLPEVLAAENEPDPLTILSAKVNELNGSSWTIELKDRDGKKDPQTDVIRFSGNQINLDGLEEEGYPSTNYTPSLGRDFKLMIIQSMKQNENGDTIFLRGELRGDSITGVLSRQPKKGKKTTFVVSGSRDSGMDAAAEAPPAVEPAEDEAAAQADPAQEPPTPVVEETVIAPPPPPVIQKPVVKTPPPPPPPVVRKPMVKKPPPPPVRPKPVPVRSRPAPPPAKEKPLPWWKRFMKK